VNYSNWAAARMDSISDYLRGADFPTMLRDAGRFARRRREVLLVGTFLTGLLVGRFLKASRRGAAEPWTSATGRWHEALQKGTRVVSAAAHSLKQGAEARGLRPEAVVETDLGSGSRSPSPAIVFGGSDEAITLLKNDHTAV
jgi:hypothetical protein